MRRSGEIGTSGRNSVVGGPEMRSTVVGESLEAADAGFNRDGIFISRASSDVRHPGVNVEEEHTRCPPLPVGAPSLKQNGTHPEKGNSGAARCETTDFKR